MDALEKSVEWMTLQKLRDELHRRARPATTSRIWRMSSRVASAQAMIENALRHQLFQKELQRRPSSG